MIEWYIPWNQIDLGLKIQLVLWFAAVVLSYWIFWRSLVRKRPWLTRSKSESRSQEHDCRDAGGRATQGAVAEGSETPN